MKNKMMLKRVGKIASSVLFCVFVAICLIGLVMAISAKKDADGAVTMFGTQLRLVRTSSMEECDLVDVSGYDVQDIPAGSVVFVDVVPEDPEEAKEWYKDLEIGDVLTFKYVYTTQVTITHRITGLRPETDGYTIRLQGDNRTSEDGVLEQTIKTFEKNSPNYVIGKVTGQSYALGLLLRVLQSPAGLICLVILPSLVILVLEIFKIYRTMTADKRKADQQQIESQQNELDELKRRLAQLEGAQDARAETPPSTDGNADPPTE